MNLSSIGCGDGGWVGPIQASQLIGLIVKASEVRHLGSNTSKNMILEWCMIPVIVDMVTAPYLLLSGGARSVALNLGEFVKERMDDLCIQYGSCDVKQLFSMCCIRH